MSSPAVSICIPAYNASALLGETLETVRRQSHPQWELVVVEDGSADGTQQLVEAFARTVSQPVRYLRHEKNRGLTTTRNTGIAAAAADWIAILDADDLWETNHLETLMFRASAGDVELVHAGSILFEHGTGRHLEVRAPSAATQTEFPISLFCGGYIIQPSSVLLHRRLWERAGKFDPTFSHCEDREMWLRCARAGGKFVYTGHNTCLYRKHAAAMSKAALAMAVGAARLLEKHLDWTEIPRDLRKRKAAEAWVSAGRLALRTRPLEARQHFQRSLAIRVNTTAATFWLAAWILNLVPFRSRGRP
ncbi:MAG TPA: glycosyltransferase [Candidatus Synoicihabitans sp.]|nr:glycosyltransferase [Candidatus Synoicihabitans sp.]